MESDVADSLEDPEEVLPLIPPPPMLFTDPHCSGGAHALCGHRDACICWCHDRDEYAK